MATMKEHVGQMHEEIAAKARRDASNHRALSKAHGEAMGKEAVLGTAHEYHKACKAVHDAAAQADDATAEKHDAMGQECEKAARTELEKANQVMPTRVSAVAPPAPTAVPRFGAPSPATSTQINPLFKRLIESPDEEEQMTGYGD